VIAGVPLTAGAVLLTQLSLHTSIYYLIGAYLIIGVGCGLVNAPISSTAVSGMPLDQAGVAGAIASTSRQVGSALGVAVTGSIVAAGLGSAFISSSHTAWAVIAGCSAVIIALGVLSTGSWALDTAKRNGERLRQRAEQTVS
jgi:MFS family permease